MDTLTQVIEREYTNASLTVTVKKQNINGRRRFHLKIKEEKYSNGDKRTMYTSHDTDLIFWGNELMEFRTILEKALLLLEAK